MQNRCLPGMIMCLLAGCSTAPSLSQAMHDLNARYDGRKADQFFLSYGRAASEHTLDNGDKTYRWVSLDPVATDSAAHAYRVYGPGHTSYGVPGSKTEPTESGYCEIEIQADSKDIIRKLAIRNDSLGKWSNSRCSEIFAAPPSQ